MARKLTFLLILSVLVLSNTLVGHAAPRRQSPPVPIQYGQTVEGSIDETQTSVSYVFDAAAGDQINAVLTVTSGNLIPGLTLTTFNGTLLTTNDNSVATNIISVSYVIPAQGAYLLNVTAAAGSGAGTTGIFQLTLAQGIIASTPPDSTEAAETPIGVPTTDTVIEETEIPSVSPTSSIPAAISDDRLQVIRIGTSVSATLGEGNNFNLYAFEGRAGQSINVASTNTGFQPLLVLYQSDFTELFRSQPGTALNTALPQDGLYFIAAAVLQDGDGGVYGFNLSERGASTTDSTLSTSDTLAYGDTANGAISNTVPLQRYRFQGAAGDIVTITMSAVSGDLDSYLLLADTSGTSIAQNDNVIEGTTDAELTVTLPEDREYFIIATRRGQEQGITAGNFILTLASDSPPRVLPSGSGQLPAEFEGLPQLNYGQSIGGEINNAAFINFYVFYGEQGDHVEINMESTSTLDPLLILLDDGRIPLAEHDDLTDTNKNSLIEFQLPRTGYYAVVATRFDQAEGLSQGTYELSLELTAGPAFEAGLPAIDRLAPVRLSAGETPSASFDPLQFASVFTFSAAAGSLIDFAVTADAGTVATVILTDSNLNYITASNNGILLGIAAPRSDDYLAFVAPQVGPAANISGNYIVALNAEGDSINTPSAPQESLPVAYGANVRGTISDDVPEMRYVFQGREGDVVEISMTAAPAAEPLDTFLILQDAEGDMVSENDDIQPGVIRNSFVRATLPANGEYTIVATRFSDTDGPLSSGDFELTLQYLDPTLAGIDRDATMIRYGETLTATITAETYLIFYYFEGQQGDEILVEVDTIDGTLDPLLYLYAQTSTGEFILLTANDDSPLGNTYDPLITYTLPRNGGYLVAVTRYSETAADPTDGTFNITLRLQNPSE